MAAEDIFGFVIVCITAMLMIGIGIYQVNSKSPVGFWSGVEPHKATEITDVKSYNRKHGMMWILYGAGMIASYFIGMILLHTYLCAIPLIAEVFGGMIFMIFYHTKLDKLYYIKHE